MELHGLHHITAVTGDASENVRFYTQVLGMRLVKKTVNQDDVSAYHLFYGDERGSPGTELTFFDWPYVGPAVPGTGTISTIGLRVAGRAALEWWARRFDELRVSHSGVVPGWDGRALIRFTDPEGQRLELADDGGVPGGAPWAKSPVPAEMGIHGLHSVTLVVAQGGPTARILTDVLGFRRLTQYPLQDDPSRGASVFGVGAGGPGAYVHVIERPDLRPGRAGIGGVHHAAFRTPDETEQVRWRSRIAGAGLGVTPVVDRYYFRSIYFHEPGNVLFEIATDGPGFATDEDLDHLGERLALPPFLEPYRREIEAGLRPIDT